MTNQPKSRVKRGRRWLVVGLAIATLAIVPTACGSSTGSSVTTTTTPPGY